MEVDEDYNPTGQKSSRQSKLDYLKKQRNREAEELRLKYLGPNAPAPPNSNHNEGRGSLSVKAKPFNKEKVKYVFIENEEIEKDSPKIKPQCPMHAHAGHNDSYSEILQQKEHIRSLITPNAPDQNQLDLGNK